MKTNPSYRHLPRYQTPHKKALHKHTHFPFQVYADAIGSAGSDLTSFDWPRIRPIHIGAGTWSETGLRLLGGEASLELWVQ